MPKYRKKPVVIEAFQVTRKSRQNNWNWPKWLHEAWQKDWPEVGAVSPVDWPNSKGDDRLQVATLGGSLIVSWDGWIIQGVKGELYPINDDIFKETCEPVE